jgi:hypothetical protein
MSTTSMMIAKLNHPTKANTMVMTVTITMNTNNRDRLAAMPFLYRKNKPVDISRTLAEVPSIKIREPLTFTGRTKTPHVLSWLGIG